MIYNWINSNRRDSPIWQRGFLTAGGAEKLKEFWDEEGSDQEPGVVSETEIPALKPMVYDGMYIYIYICL